MASPVFLFSRQLRIPRQRKHMVEGQLNMDQDERPWYLVECMCLPSNFHRRGAVLR